LEIVKFALASSIEIPCPRELLDKNALWEDGFKGFLGLRKAVKGYAHVHVMGGVLHDVVH